MSTPTLEEFAKDLLAKKLDDIAQVLFEAAKQVRQRAASLRAETARKPGVPYMHEASQALAAVGALLPNLGLAQAFEYAALADQARADAAKEG